MGLKIMSAFFTAKSDEWKYERVEQMTPKLNDGQKEEETKLIQLFTANLGAFFMTKDAPITCWLTFTVHLTGITGNNYQVLPLDGLLSPQLMLSPVLNHDGTDSTLISSNGKNFPVHKWILAARSPVFATLFSKEEVELNYFIDCTEDEMKQFIKFVYTGELEGLVTQTILQLADQFRIKALEDLYETASQVFSVEDMALLAFHLEPGSQNCVRFRDLCELENE